MNNIKNFHAITLSSVGVNEDRGVLQKWYFAEGEFVSSGDILCDFETTKTSIEVVAENDGYMLPIVKEETEVRAGDIIGLLVINKNEIISIKKDHQVLQRKPDIAEKIITNKAKELIKKHNIDLNILPRSKNIIRSNDLLEFIEQKQNIKGIENIIIDSKRESLMIYGAGKGAVTIFEAVDVKSYNVICFIDDNKLHKNSLLELPVFHSSMLPTLKDKGIKYVACEIMNGKVRLKIKEKIEKFGLELINVIHSNSYVSKSAKLGTGNFIKADAIIETNTTIGDCCIIDNGSTIPHDNQIGNGCHIAPGVNMGSSVVIGDLSVIGIGASISTNVKIGKNCIISVGSAVTKDIPDNSIVEGVPAKVIGAVKK